MVSKDFVAVFILVVDNFKTIHINDIISYCSK